MKNGGSILILGAFMAIYSCNSIGTSSNEPAYAQNLTKFDSSEIKTDVRFAMQVANANMMEAQLGSLALNNCSLRDVRQLGQRMIDDHINTGSELVNIAQAKDISLPSAPDNGTQKKIDLLRQKKGALFDKYYIYMIVDGHKDAIDLFQREADKGNDPEIKAWAYRKLPLLQSHLQMARAIQKKMDDLD
jgi:putative membrane protein